MTSHVIFSFVWRVESKDVWIVNYASFNWESKTTLTSRWIHEDEQTQFRIIDCIFAIRQLICNKFFIIARIWILTYRFFCIERFEIFLCDSCFGKKISKFFKYKLDMVDIQWTIYSSTYNRWYLCLVVWDNFKFLLGFLCLSLILAWQSLLSQVTY